MKDSARKAMYRKQAYLKIQKNKIKDQDDFNERQRVSRAMAKGLKDGWRSDRIAVNGSVREPPYDPNAVKEMLKLEHKRTSSLIQRKIRKQ
jgi:hypothetical protein